MANIRIIKRRIRSIQNTSKITRAMEMVAASKMKRAQERDLASRPYDEKMRQVVADLSAAQATDEYAHPLLEKREPKRIEVIHITSDRGLCGGLNSNMNRMTAGFILEQAVPVTLIAVGRRGADFLRRTRQDVKAEFIELGDRPGVIDIMPIAHIVTADYTSKDVDMVYLAFNDFINTVNQRPVIRQLLPVEPATMQPGENVDYIFEPDSRAVLAQMLPRFVEMQIYHAVLESIASEQSARMVAMRNATDNAKDMIQELTLVYNKARQEMITKELLDITAGAAALT